MSKNTLIFLAVFASIFGFAVYGLVGMGQTADANFPVMPELRVDAEEHSVLESRLGLTSIEREFDDYEAAVESTRTCIGQGVDEFLAGTATDVGQDIARRPILVTEPVVSDDEFSINYSVTVDASALPAELKTQGNLDRLTQLEDRCRESTNLNDTELAYKLDFQADVSRLDESLLVATRCFDTAGIGSEISSSVDDIRGDIIEMVRGPNEEDTVAMMDCLDRAPAITWEPTPAS